MGMALFACLSKFLVFDSVAIRTIIFFQQME